MAFYDISRRPLLDILRESPWPSYWWGWFRWCVKFRMVVPHQMGLLSHRKPTPREIAFGHELERRLIAEGRLPPMAEKEPYSCVTL